MLCCHSANRRFDKFSHRWVMICQVDYSWQITGWPSHGWTETGESTSHGYFHVKALCVKWTKKKTQMKLNEPTSNPQCVDSKWRLKTLICQPVYSHSVPKSPFPWLCWFWPRSASSCWLWSIYGTGLEGRSAICMLPAKAFPQEEVFWLISIAMSWGHFPFCDLIRPHNKTEPNMFGISLGDFMKTGKREWPEVLPANQQGAPCWHHWKMSVHKCAWTFKCMQMWREAKLSFCTRRTLCLLPCNTAGDAGGCLTVSWQVQYMYGKLGDVWKKSGFPGYVVFNLNRYVVFPSPRIFFCHIAKKLLAICTQADRDPVACVPKSIVFLSGPCIWAWSRQKILAEDMRSPQPCLHKTPVSYTD